MIFNWKTARTNTLKFFLCEINSFIKYLHSEYFLMKVFIISNPEGNIWFILSNFVGLVISEIFKLGLPLIDMILQKFRGLCFS